MKIITHNGQAHMDEVLATTIIRHYHRYKEADNPSVVVRDPKAKQEQGDWIVDVGGSLDPTRLQFDHHQPGAGALAAFQHVAQYLGHHEKLSKWAAWYMLMGDMDTTSPFGVLNEYFKVPKNMVGQLLEGLSPLEKMATLLFERDPNHRFFKETMVEWFVGQLEACGQLELLEETVVEDSVVVPVGSIFVLDCRIEKVRGNALLTKITHRKAAQHGCAVIVSPDDRDDGWSLYRMHDNPKVDFSKLGGIPGVIFAHQTGFIAKTTLNADVMGLVKMALKGD
jgi:hypothetical protein